MYNPLAGIALAGKTIELPEIENSVIYSDQEPGIPLVLVYTLKLFNA